MAYQTLTGRPSNQLGNWIPGVQAPGVSMVSNVVENVSKTLYQQSAQNKSATWAAEQIVKGLGLSLEQSLPFVSILSDVYEAKNDIRGVHVCTLVVSKLSEQYETKYHKAWKKADRNTVQALLHALTGGWENPNEQQQTGPGAMGEGGMK
jgi:hypothetical protein